MKKLSFLLVIFSFLISCKTNNNGSKKGNYILDDIGNKFSLEQKPQRVISLAPNLTEIIYDLKLEKYLVGNTIYCDFPKEAKHIEKVGDMLTFNFEKILTLEPDIIFITVEGNTKETYDKFKELGLKIFVSNPRNYEGIKKTYRDIGKIFSVNTESTIKNWDSTIIGIQSYSKNFNKTGMFIVQLAPLMVAGPNTFLNEYLNICGLKNIAYDSPLNYPIINREEIIKRNPDYIIIPTSGDDSVDKIISLYPEWRNLKAIRDRKIIFVDNNLFLRPGPKFAKAIENLFSQVLQLEKKVQHH